MKRRGVAGRRFFMALGALALVLACRSLASADDAISPQQAAAWIAENKDLQLIDVRTPGEYSDGHLAKAKLIPLQELQNRLAEIDKRKPILLYCGSGHRSRKALKILQDSGYIRARHMEGGLNAWQAAGLPITN